MSEELTPFNAQIGKIFGPFIPSSTPQTTTHKPMGPVDSIEKAQQENDAKKAQTFGQFVLERLSNPYLNYDVSACLHFCEEGANRVINAICDNMLKTVEEQKLMDKISSQEWQLKIDEMKERIRTGMDGYYNAATVQAGKGATSAVSAMWALSAIATSPIPGVSATTGGIYSVLSQALMAAVPPGLQATVLTLAAAINAGIYVPTMGPILAQAILSEGKVDDQLAANLYRDQVVYLVGQNAIGNLINTVIFSNLPEGPEAKQQVIVRVELAYLLSSLALFYKKETGGLTKGEVLGMVSGQIKLDPNDPRQSLIATIRTLRSTMTEGEFNDTLDRLGVLFDEDPSENELTATTSTLRKLWMGLDKDQEIAA